MGLFATLLEKLGFKKPETAPVAKPVTPAAPVKPAAPVAPAAPVVNKNLSSLGDSRQIENMPPVQAPHPVEMPMVDVVSKLEQLAKSNPQKLDWKVSIVDLLKLVGMDSSLQARKEMATELGCPADLMGGDYAQMNMWLHKEVLQKIAENGGNIPQDLLKK